jgi:rod shape-determining protein MreC
VSLRDGPFQDIRVPLTWTAAVAVIIAGIVGVALLLNDRRETAQLQVYGATKSVVDTVSTPMSRVIAAPGRWTSEGVSGVRDYFFAGSENHHLRQELAEMQRLRDETIQLKNTNARLRAILGLSVDPPLPMVAAEVISDARGPFANSRLADAGSDKGVMIGNPVMSERGLIGRVVGVTHGASRVLLLTDVSSRTPVMIERTNARAILTGDGGAHPKMAYMRGVDPAKIGDRVLTSGDGGVFPRGLPVGVAVKGLDGAWRVKLDCDDGPIDFVRILLFRSFDQMVDQKALANATVPPLPPADAAAIAAQIQPPAPTAAVPISAGEGKSAPTAKVADAKSLDGKPGPVKPAAAKTVANKPSPAKPSASAKQAVSNPPNPVVALPPDRAGISP